MKIQKKKLYKYGETELGLFYAEMLGYYIHCTFIFTFCALFLEFLRKLFFLIQFNFILFIYLFIYSLFLLFYPTECEWLLKRPLYDTLPNRSEYW